MTKTSTTIDPRDKVLELVDEGVLDRDNLIQAMLKYMSWDDVTDMIQVNYDIDLQDS